MVHQEHLKGIGWSAVVASIAWVLSFYTPHAFNSIILALLLGIVVNNLRPLPSTAESGLGFTSGKMLELSIIFLAFSINYVSIAALGAGSFAAVAVTVVLVILFTWYMARRFNCPGSTGWLVGFGTAICGSSAIAALAPSVSKDKTDIGIAMAVVNLFGSLGMLAMPFVLSGFDLDITRLGLLIGGSLHSVGNVVGAGYAISDEAGEAALTIKMARVALLSPGLILFNVLIHAGKGRSWKEHLQLPWYLVGFFLISLFVSFVDLPTPFLKTMDGLGKAVLTLAMAAIGLKVGFRKLLVSGRRGIGFGLVIFIAQVLILLGLGYLLV